MSKSVKDSFLDLEKHRQLLESNIEKLRKSLQHWQNWEVEYEGLKEEVLAAGPSPSQEQLLVAGRDYDSKLVTRKEVEDILGAKIPRNADQVTNILDRRIDYVSQNVKTLEKQVEAAETKLAAATVISTPDVRNEEGLPLTEIVEELDEEGNVLSGRIETQGSARGQLLEVLEKAGVKDHTETDRKESSESSTTGTAAKRETFKVNIKDRVETEAEILSITKATAHKSVKFAEGTKLGPETQKSRTARRIEATMNPGKMLVSTEEEPPVIPADESPEDAALRREMLEYSMSEVGAVVAELDLEDGSDFTDEEFDFEETSSIEDEEDGYGRSTKKVMDQEMRQQMIEIEKRLGLKMMENVGPNPDVQVHEKKLQNVSLQRENFEQRRILPESGSVKKGVRFAEELDIAPAAERIESKQPGLTPQLPSKSPIGDIVERAPPELEATTAKQPAQRQSRFKSARLSQSPTQPLAGKPQSAWPDSEPNAIDNATLSNSGDKIREDQIIERKAPTSLPLEPDEFDPALLQREATNEYFRSRNRMIQKQGGFVKDPVEKDNGIIPLTEEEGGPKKISRFKAARLARP